MVHLFIHIIITLGYELDVLNSLSTLKYSDHRNEIFACEFLILVYLNLLNFQDLLTQNSKNLHYTLLATLAHQKFAW